MALDAVIFCLVLAASLCAPVRVCRSLRLVERPLRWIGNRPGLAVVLSGVLAFVLNAALSLSVHIPQPQVHDEFSYLLQADTFAHGRVTNPPHPLGVHFESMHILQVPSYVSKYPPAQGVMLALGEVICGQPILGVWLSAGLASSAIAWMLLGFMRPRWAFLGGLLTALHPLMIFWSQGYWGGAVAACGGALVLGAAKRLADRPIIRHALLCAGGMAILANSRPFEGLVLTLLAAAAVLAQWLRAPGPGVGLVLTRVLLPILLVLLPIAAAMGYYNWRVTGDALRMPYTVHQATYAVAPPFLWDQEMPQPDYHHQELRDLYAEWEVSFFEQQRTLSGFVAGCTSKLSFLFQNYVPVLVYQVPLLAIPWLIRRSKCRRWLIVLALFSLALLCETWMQSHYAAPAMGLVLLFVIQGLRIVRSWAWQRKPAGRMLVRCSMILSALMLATYCVQLSRAKSQGWHVQRAHILKHLARQPDRSLVIVHYGKQHSPHDEWIYNEADIDRAKVVWARDMGPSRNRELLEYYHDRSVWLLEADAAEPGLVPYAADR